MAITVVVVANGAPPKNLAKTIDKADEVIRFGNTPYYGARAGRRTTALVLRGGSDGHGIRLSTGAGKWKLRKDVLKQRPTIWLLPGRHGPDRAAMLQREFDPYKARYPSVEGLEVEVISREWWQTAMIELAQFKEDPKAVSPAPSAGLWVLHWMLHRKAYRDADIRLAGFAWRYSYHPVRQEYDLVQQWIKEGRIALL